MIPPRVRSHLVNRCNARLDQAEQQGITTLSDLSIDEQCLPAWPSMRWDPEEEAPHAAVQARLRDVETAQELGEAVRRDLVAKGNRRLEVARSLGVALADAEFGHDLMLRWPRSGPAGELPGREEREVVAVPGTDAAGMPFSSARPARIFIDLGSDHSDTDDAAETPNSPCSIIRAEDEIMADVAETSHVRNNSNSNYNRYCRYYAKDVYFADSEESSSDESDDPYDRSTPPPPALNIAHGIQLVGGPRHLPEVDLEVYLAESDSEADDLPELELVVDGDAWEHHFGVPDDAVDVELSGVEVRTSFDAEEEGDGDDDDEDEDEAVVPRERVRMKARLARPPWEEGVAVGDDEEENGEDEEMLDEDISEISVVSSDEDED